MKKVLLIGTIDETHTNVSGQYDKTEIIRDGLRKHGYSVQFVNMMNWKRKPFSLFLAIASAYFHTDDVLFLASLNGTKVILNILSCLQIISKKSAFQIVIGGQSNFRFVQNSRWYRNKINNLKAVFVEIESMIEDYRTVGLTNVHYLPNCKDLNIDRDAINNAKLCEPYRFCTYSRVTPEKGIAEAVDVVETMNKEYGRQYCSLDIYGTYLPEDEEWFLQLMGKVTSAISFKGRIDRKDSIAILSQYDLMLFPTQHTGEGVPGGLIDCYEAGLPIVTCNTSYMTRIVHDGKTGFIYNQGNQSSLEDTVKKYTIFLSKTERRILRINCQDEARKYDTTSVINTLSEFINKTKYES